MALAVSVHVAMGAASREPSHRVLKVGPGEQFTRPSEAAAAVRPGDTVTIAPGTYVDCAIWPSKASPVTIEGSGEGVILRDKVCEGKALFVVKADDVTVRNITFADAKAADHNGAGIRSEGRNLVVENSSFIDNEEGILAGSLRRAKIIVRGGYFKGNGNCVAACAHGIYVGHIALLRIERTRFVEQYAGHHVKSRAERTELIGNMIEDGAGGTASYLVDIPNGGILLMRDNVLRKGIGTENRSAAVVIGAEGLSNATPEILIENNRFTSDLPQATIFVLNLTGTNAVLRGNSLFGKVRALAISADKPDTHSVR